MAVIERYPEAVQAEGGEQLDVLFIEEVVEESVKKEVVIIGTEDSKERFSETKLVPGEPSDEVLHLHPSPETAPTEEHGAVFFVEDLRARDAEKGASWE